MHLESFIIIVTAFSTRPADAHPGRTLQPRAFQKATPALGWNSWNAFACNGASASAAMTAANQFKSLGLAAVGYEYINIDDCWTLKTRDGSGKLQPDPSKWPNGVKTVVDQIHGMGFKFGLYGDAGQMTCAGYPGSSGHEQQDAQLLSSWGVDYWKYDNCYTNCNGQYPQTCWSARNSQAWYATMGNYISAQSHPILYSLCSWGLDNVWTWGKSVHGSSWRMNGDIANNWASVASIAARAAGLAQYAGPGGFNDLDMLEIGNGGLSAAEERAHFGLWAIAKSPLIIGTDLSKISSSSLAVLKNTGLIAINQDPLGKAAGYFTPKNTAGPTSGQLYQYWAGALTDGVVLGLVASNGAQSFSVNFADVPGLGSGTFEWTEMYTGKTGSGTSVSVSLASHDMAVYKVTSGSGGTPVTTATATTTKPPTSTTNAPPAASCAAMYAQCGGDGWQGPKCCVAGSTCKSTNQYYSQCL